MDDDRSVLIHFTEEEGGTQIVVSFDPENEYPHEYQRSGWQAILDNFKRYVETH
jgi:uncharacterized protein YndB with AHSA1/START domain